MSLTIEQKEAAIQRRKDVLRLYCNYLAHGETKMNAKVKTAADLRISVTTVYADLRKVEL